MDDLTKSWIYSVLAILGLIAIGYASLIFFPKDNLIEQAVEKVIEQKTGLNVDLTP